MSIHQKSTIVTCLLSDIYKNILCEYADKFDTFMPTNLILNIHYYADKSDTYTDVKISMSSIDF